MELMLLRMFQAQVAAQCEIVLHQYDELNAAVQRCSPSEAFAALQALLTAAANISKACWGQKGKKTAQRAPLRTSIGLGENSPIQDTDMRNSYDHIDERLEDWWQESPNHDIADGNIGPANMVSGLRPVEMFRGYDPATQTAFFWGESFDIRAIVNEVNRIRPKVTEEASKPHWVP